MERRDEQSRVRDDFQERSRLLLIVLEHIVSRHLLTDRRPPFSHRVGETQCADVGVATNSSLVPATDKKTAQTKTPSQKLRFSERIKKLRNILKPTRRDYEMRIVAADDQA